MTFLAQCGFHTHPTGPVFFQDYHSCVSWRINPDIGTNYYSFTLLADTRYFLISSRSCVSVRRTIHFVIIYNWPQVTTIINVSSEHYGIASHIYWIKLLAVFFYCELLQKEYITSSTMLKCFNRFFLKCHIIWIYYHLTCHKFMNQPVTLTFSIYHIYLQLHITF